MTAWADTRGCPRVVISEHHGSDDGYLPSPFVFGAAVAGRTEHVRIMISALVLTLRDPVATAEDAAVLDLISGGRLELTVVPGYVRDEFAMFGIPFERRGALFEEKLATFVDLLSGAPHTTDGHQVRITPLPVQRPRPFIIVGGAAPKRAARYGDAFLPAVADRHQAEVYREECRSLGKGDGILLWPGGPMWVFVTEDPERSWAELAPHALARGQRLRRLGRRRPGRQPVRAGPGRQGPAGVGHLRRRHPRGVHRPGPRPRPPGRPQAEATGSRFRPGARMALARAVRGPGGAGAGASTPTGGPRARGGPPAGAAQLTDRTGPVRRPSWPAPSAPSAPRPPRSRAPPRPRLALDGLHRPRFSQMVGMNSTMPTEADPEPVLPLLGRLGHAVQQVRSSWFWWAAR